MGTMNGEVEIHHMHPIDDIDDCESVEACQPDAAWSGATMPITATWTMNCLMETLLVKSYAKEPKICTIPMFNMPFPWCTPVFVMEDGPQLVTKLLIIFAAMVVTNIHVPITLNLLCNID